MSSTYLRFSAGNDIISWGIQQKTACKWSHVDFLVGDRFLGALPGGGVQYRSSIHGESRFAVFELPIENGAFYAASQIGKPYDWGAVIGLASPFPIKRNWRDDRFFFCSELVYMSLEAAGLKLFDDDCWGVTPRDIRMSPLLKKVSD